MNLCSHFSSRRYCTHGSRIVRVDVIHAPMPLCRPPVRERVTRCKVASLLFLRGTSQAAYQVVRIRPTRRRRWNLPRVEPSKYHSYAEESTEVGRRWNLPRVEPSKLMHPHSGTTGKRCAWQAKTRRRNVFGATCQQCIWLLCTW